MSHDDFEVEPIPGLPAVPPDGERILWSGSPYWPTLARRAFHIDKIAIYFAVLIFWRMGNQWYGDAAASTIVAAAVTPLIVAAVALIILTTIAYLTARSTIYTITSKRIVMRFGVALPITFNLPFASIASAGLRRFADAKGDLPVELTGEKRLPYLVLWPHARPWHFKAPQPMLRCVHDAPRVAQVLSAAFASHTARSMIVISPEVSAESDWGASQTAAVPPRLVAAE